MVFCKNNGAGGEKRADLTMAASGAQLVALMAERVAQLIKQSARQPMLLAHLAELYKRLYGAMPVGQLGFVKVLDFMMTLDMFVITRDQHNQCCVQLRASKTEPAGLGSAYTLVTLDRGTLPLREKPASAVVLADSERPQSKPTKMTEITVEEVGQQLVAIMAHDPRPSWLLTQLINEYKRVHGATVPYWALGYRKLSLLLQQYEQDIITAQEDNVTVVELRQKTYAKGRPTLDRCRHFVAELVAEHPAGVPLLYFRGLYQTKFGVPCPHQNHGFAGVVDFLKCMPDVCTLDRVRLDHTVIRQVVLRGQVPELEVAKPETYRVTQRVLLAISSILIFNTTAGVPLAGLAKRYEALTGEELTNIVEELGYASELEFLLAHADVVTVNMDENGYYLTSTTDHEGISSPEQIGKKYQELATRPPKTLISSQQEELKSVEDRHLCRLGSTCLRDHCSFIQLLPDECRAITCNACVKFGCCKKRPAGPYEHDKRLTEGETIITASEPEKNKGCLSSSNFLGLPALSRALQEIRPSALQATAGLGFSFTHSIHPPTAAQASSVAAVVAHSSRSSSSNASNGALVVGQLDADLLTHALPTAAGTVTVPSNTTSSTIREQLAPQLQLHLQQQGHQQQSSFNLPDCDQRLRLQQQLEHHLKQPLQQQQQQQHPMTLDQLLLIVTHRLQLLEVHLNDLRKLFDAECLTTGNPEEPTTNMITLDQLYAAAISQYQLYLVQKQTVLNNLAQRTPDLLSALRATDASMAHMPGEPGLASLQQLFSRDSMSIVPPPQQQQQQQSQHQHFAGATAIPPW